MATQTRFRRIGSGIRGLARETRPAALGLGIQTRADCCRIGLGCDKCMPCLSLREYHARKSLTIWISYTAQASFRLYIRNTSS
eukprot:COSAG02_NODE_6296_length_3670_cov_5.072529_3_plen_83_part_00